MRDYRFVGPVNPGPPRQIRNDIPPPKGNGNNRRVVDPVVQRHFGTTQPGELVQFDGLTDQDNQDVIGTRYVPPDTNADVGPSHVVEYINTIWSVYDKSGTLLLGPLPGNSFWQGLGGPCELTDDGDPIVKYDRQADRWMVSQFAVEGPFEQCIAVSTTGDPTGTWFQYDFHISNTDFPDYPKFGVWPDAYYMTSNIFGNQFYGGAFAFNRTKMLVGDPSAEQIFFTTVYNGLAEGGVLPSDLNGTVIPPFAGEPNFFMTYDTQLTPECNGACLLIWQFHSDFVTPGNSTFTGPVVIAVPAFNTPVCGSFRDQCVPQLGSPELLETLSQDLMYPLPYRNFGDHEAIFSSHTVGDGTGIAQVRWYEVRDPFGTPTLYQSGTYAPDSTHRWMPSIAVDQSGNVALNYSRSDTTLHPQCAITGRLVGDPLGTMGSEDVWYAGAGSQQNSFSRWGDYTSIFLDPVDDCTFWGINEYYATTTDFQFRTRIGSFKFPSCTSGPIGILEGTVTDTSANPIQNATVTAGAASTLTNVAGHYTFTLPVGTYDMTASKFGYTPDSANGVPVTDGGDTVQNFVLTPNLILLVNGVVSDGSGEGWRLYSKIDITGPPGFPPTTIYTDPVTGYYSILLPAGFTYHFKVTSLIPGYNVLNQDVDVPIPTGHNDPNDPPGFVANFALKVDGGLCIAPGYTPGPSVPLLSEAFDGGVLPPGWSVINNSGNGAGWVIQTDFAPCFEVPGNPTGGTGAFALVNSDCDGFVTDDEEMRTSSIDVSAFDGAKIQFNQDYFNLGDTADVDVSTDGGSTWSNVLRQTASDRGPAVVSAAIPGAGGQADVRLRFHYYNAFFAWWWAVDNINVNGATCLPNPGGLVVGNVFDANTGLGLNGATVVNLPDGESTTTFPTPGDDNVPDGFYALFAGSGPQPFQASLTGYTPQTKSTSVIPNSTIRLDFSLGAGLLTASPSVMNSKVDPGDTDTQILTITNSGSGDATFKILEGPGPLSRPRPHTFASLEDRRLASKRVPAGHWDSKNTNHIPAMPKAPKNVRTFPVGSAGNVISSFPSNLAIGWGVGFDANASHVWISNPTYIGGGDDKNHSFTTDGTDTGNSIDISGAGGLWVGDQAFNTNTGMLWGVNVGGDNCLAEMNPVTLLVTGNEICGSPWTNISQRGVAYDAVGDTYFVGGWNEGVIYHIDGTGTVLDSKFVAMSISGLAYDSGTGHLLVMQNQPAGNDVTVLDANNNYNIIGAFQVLDNGSPAFGDFQQAGMEFDCGGNLWAINQATQQVYLFTSGGEPAACGVDVPWVSENPTEGLVPAGGTFPVDVTFDSAGLFPGLRQAHLNFTTDTPYPMAGVSLNFTVRFLDVLDNVPPGTDPFENFIYAAAGANIMHGCSFFNFCPSALVTRADMAGYIWRSVHGPFTPPPVYTGIFGDVFFSDYNADYIQGIYDDGITAGCQASPLLFCPNQSIPRAQMAVFIEKGVRGSAFVPPPCAGIFDDVSCPPTPEDPYGDWVELLFNDGITAGCSTIPPLFCPLQPIPNEQMAVFIVKAFGFPVLP